MAPCYMLCLNSSAMVICCMAAHFLLLCVSFLVLMLALQSPLIAAYLAFCLYFVLLILWTISEPWVKIWCQLNQFKISGVFSMCYLFFVGPCGCQLQAGFFLNGGKGI